MNAAGGGTGWKACAIGLAALAMAAGTANADTRVRVSVGVGAGWHDARPDWGGGWGSSVGWGSGWSACPEPVLVVRPAPVCPPRVVVIRDVCPPAPPVCDDRPRVVERVIRVERPARVVEVVRVRHAETGLGRAWDRFAEGCYLDALRLFQGVAADRPDEGEAMVGYALAAALRDDERSAVWSMRRAFEEDSRGAVAPCDRDIAGAIAGLADRYERRTERGVGRRASADPDELFMLAATAHLSGDRETARRAIERAIDKGDRSASALNLRERVRDARG